MIDAGEYICPLCGNIKSSAFYMNAQYGAGVLLARKRMGRKYELVPYIPGRESVDNAREEANFQLVDFREAADGMPDSITVRDLSDARRKKVVLRRCCPSCTDEEGRPLVMRLPPSCGLLPTFFIAVVGGVGGGKGSWLDAIVSMQNQTNLAKAGFPCSIGAEQDTDVVEVNVKTNIASPGNTKHLYLYQDNRPYAMIVLRDFAGELFGDFFEDSDESVNLLGMLKRPDAILFVTDETTPEGRQHRLGSMNWLKLHLPRVGPSEKEEPIPMGVILTHADAMMDEGFMVGTGKKIPLLNRKTFPPDTPDSYRLYNFMRRVELEDAIARQYSPHVDALRSGAGIKAEKSFIVNSATPFEATVEEGTQMRNNFSDGINVYDPLLWVLNRLKLFPLA